MQGAMASAPSELVRFVHNIRFSAPDRWTYWILDKILAIPKIFFLVFTFKTSTYSCYFQSNVLLSISFLLNVFGFFANCNESVFEPIIIRIYWHHKVMLSLHIKSFCSFSAPAELYIKTELAWFVYVNSNQGYIKHLHDKMKSFTTENVYIILSSIFVISSILCISHTCFLTHCGLVMPYGHIDLGQHWLG